MLSLASRVTGDYGGNSTAGIKTERVNDDATAKLQHTVQQSHDEIRRLIEQGFDTCRRELSLQFQSLQAGSSLSSSTYTSSLEVVTEKAVKELQGSQQKVEKEVDELRLLKQEIVAMKEAVGCTQLSRHMKEHTEVQYYALVFKTDSS